MKPLRSVLFAPALLASLFFSGCASSYDAYQGGKVPYCYCPPSPLAHADSDACPTCVASKYLTRPPVEPSVAADPGYPTQ